MSYSETRKALAAVLRAMEDGPVVYEAGETNVSVPCFVIQAGTPYIERSGFATDTVRLEVVALVETAEPAAAADAVDELLGKLRSALQPTSFAMASADAHAEFVVGALRLSGAVATVTTERNAL